MDDGLVQVERPPQGGRCAIGAGGSEEARLVLGEDVARAVAVGAQRLQEGDEIVVPDPLELVDRQPFRLRIGLRGDLLDQLGRELGDVRQLRPRPLERGAELREEVAHPLLASGDAVREERPHLREAKARAEAQGVVELLHGGDVVVHEPQRLAPERLEQPVGEEALDLPAHPQRFHAEGRVERRCPLERLLRRLLPCDHLDER